MALVSTKQQTSRLQLSRAATSRTARRAVYMRSHKVEIDHQGKTYVLDVPEGRTILEVALDKGIDLPHDCKLGVSYMHSLSNPNAKWPMHMPWSVCRSYKCPDQL